jgi:hypothetical protein
MRLALASTEGLRGEFRATLTATCRENRATRTRAHAQAEAVLLGAAAVVGLEGTLAHSSSPAVRDPTPTCVTGAVGGKTGCPDGLRSTDLTYGLAGARSNQLPLLGRGSSPTVSQEAAHRLWSDTRDSHGSPNQHLSRWHSVRYGLRPVIPSHTPGNLRFRQGLPTGRGQHCEQLPRAARRSRWGSTGDAADVRNDCGER